MDRPSGLSYFKLLVHFWNIIFMTDTRQLRLIDMMGFISVIFAIAIAL